MLLKLQDIVFRDKNHNNLSHMQEVVMNYIFTCPAPNCNFSAKAETENPDWAVEKITEIGLFHVNHAHPQISLTADKIRTVILKNIADG
jgi:hypothetical protein